MQHDHEDQFADMQEDNGKQTHTASCEQPSALERLAAIGTAERDASLDSDLDTATCRVMWDAGEASTCELGEEEAAQEGRSDGEESKTHTDESEERRKSSHQSILPPPCPPRTAPSPVPGQAPGTEGSDIHVDAGGQPSVCGHTRKTWMDTNASMVSSDDESPRHAGRADDVVIWQKSLAARREAPPQVQALMTRCSELERTQACLQVENERLRGEVRQLQQERYEVGGCNPQLALIVGGLHSATALALRNLREKLVLKQNALGWSLGSFLPPAPALILILLVLVLLLLIQTPQHLPCNDLQAANYHSCRRSNKGRSNARASTKYGLLCLFADSQPPALQRVCVCSSYIVVCHLFRMGSREKMLLSRSARLAAGRRGQVDQNLPTNHETTRTGR